jgi:hypothetical protein
LVITTVPPLDVVMRTGRAIRPGMETGCVMAIGCATTRVRVLAVVVGVDVMGDVTTVLTCVAAGATAAGTVT